MFTFELLSAEDKPDSNEPLVECSTQVSLEKTSPVISPMIQKSFDEGSKAINPILPEMNATNLEQTKTEKGSIEEGFCCVMRMHDGVVL